MNIKDLRLRIKETRAEMKAKGIKRTSCFNGGLQGEVYSLNARMFELETQLKNLKTACRNSPVPMAAAPSLVRIVRVRDLTEHLHVTRNQLLRLRRADPSFPPPFRLGTGRNGTIAWFEGEINAWLTNRPRAVLPEKPTSYATI